MTTLPPMNEPDIGSKGDLVGIALVVLGGTGLAAYAFWCFEWLILFGIAATLFAVVLVMAVELIRTPWEEVRINELKQRERRARQLATAIAAETDQRTAELIRDFLITLPKEEGALLGLRLHAEARAARSVDDLETELAALRAALSSQVPNRRRR